jgi:ubiquinone/menaquinone biosynthesis C-methylase UbiE
MGLSDYLLYRVARVWPSPMAKMASDFGAEPGSDAYELNYTQAQFDRRVRDGLGLAVFDQDVLEIGCGHGGISCYLAAAGARRVIGIDLNRANLAWAERLRQRLASHFGPSAQLPVEFKEMDAYNLSFAENSFDVVVAENAFEHFTQPDVVMREAFRVLRPGGILLVPIFSSIYSKYGLHLKHGLKLPWANLLFSEATIIRAMNRLATEHKELYDLYPGLRGAPRHVRDLREYGDLNDITYSKFKKMAKEIGFDVARFRSVPTRFGRLLQLMPLASNSILGDIFSTGARAVLKKPKNDLTTAISVTQNGSATK